MRYVTGLAQKLQPWQDTWEVAELHRCIAAGS
jgi:hypothetical protein